MTDYEPCVEIEGRRHKFLGFGIGGREYKAVAGRGCQTCGRAEDLGVGLVIVRAGGKDRTGKPLPEFLCGQVSEFSGCLFDELDAPVSTSRIGPDLDPGVPKAAAGNQLSLFGGEPCKP